MHVPTAAIVIAFIFEAFFWLSVYFFIIRTGFRDKIHAMPVIAMCGNIAWEFMLGMGTLNGPFAEFGSQFPACPASWPGCPEGLIGFLTLSAALMDVVIAFIIIKWGVHQIKTDWLKKRFAWFVLAGIGTSFVIITTAVRDLNIKNPYPTCVGDMNVGCIEGPAPDFLPLRLDGGFTLGAILAIIMGLLFISWIINRDDLRGQSFYIALFMALGNTSAYVVAMLWSGFELATITHVLSVVALAVNYTYVILFVHRSKQLGRNPYLLKL